VRSPRTKYWSIDKVRSPTDGNEGHGRWVSKHSIKIIHSTHLELSKLKGVHHRRHSFRAVSYSASVPAEPAPARIAVRPAVSSEPPKVFGPIPGYRIARRPSSPRFWSFWAYPTLAGRDFRMAPTHSRSALVFATYHHYRQKLSGNH
jgi:hypothetical protein